MQVERRRQPGWTYRSLDQRQRELAAQVRAGGEGALLLSEVEPVITLGRRAGPGDWVWPREELGRRGVDVYEVDRGGLATYHGPGQWVLFAVDSLERLTGDRRGVRMAVEGLLEIARRVAASHRECVEVRGGAETGVWSPVGKLASVGVHIEDGVLLHGLALNAYRTPLSFAGIRPCGLNACADFLWAEADEAKFLKLGEELVSAAHEVFGASARPALDPVLGSSYKNFSSSRGLPDVGS